MAVDPVTASIAAVGLLTSIGGMFGSSRKAKKERERQEELLRQQRAANEAWYARNSGDFLNTAEAQNAINRVKEAWSERAQEARARRAITGGTPEQAAQVEKAGAKAMGDTVASLAAQGSAIKRDVENKKADMDNQATANEMQMSVSAQEAAENAKVNAVNTGIAALQLGASAINGGANTTDANATNAANAGNTSSATSSTAGPALDVYDYVAGADKWSINNYYEC